jgi:hypothetical protein
MKTIADMIAAARRKPTAPDKLALLLPKVRKGATASMTLTNLVSILDKIGWKIESTVGWVQIHQNTHLHHVFNADAESHGRAVKKAITSLPAKAVAGKTVISEVSELKAGTSGSYFTHKEWSGAEGYKVTAKDGQSVVVLPGKYDLMRDTEKQIRSSEIFAALDKIGLRGAASESLGVEEHVPADARSRENTGTCGVCWGNFKLDAGRMVLHGYQRPGWGHVLGQCSAVRMQPLETSPATAEYWLEKHLRPQLRGEERTLDRIDHDEVSEILIGRDPKKSNDWVKRGEPMFVMHLRHMRDNCARTIENLKVDIKLYETILKAWKIRPMPKDGELMRTARFFTK